MFFYQCYGLIIGSDLELPALIPSHDAVPDVRIILNQDMPTQIEAVDGIRGFEIGKQREVFFECDAGWILVTGGNQIIIRLKDPNNPEKATQYALGSGLGAIFHQRRTMALHASAVNIDGRAVLFMGKSGIGKSTTAMSFIKEGHSLISDDLSVIEFLDGQAWVHPGYPRQKITEEVLQEMGEPLNPGEKPFDEDRLKYYRSPANFCIDKTKVDHIFWLRNGDVDRPQILSEDHFRLFRAIYTHRFRSGLIKRLGVSEAHLEQSSALFKSVKIKSVIFPKNKISLRPAIELIKSELEKEA